MSYPDTGSTTDHERSVLHVTTIPATLGFVRGQIGYFKARGWDVHLLSAPGSDLTAFGKRAGVRTHAAPLTRRISPFRDLRALVCIAHVIRTLRPTIVHAHTPKAGLLAMLAATCCPSTIRIYHVRGLPLESASGLLRVVLRACDRIACGLAHRVFCESASLRRLLVAERLCAPGKCVTVHGVTGSGIDAQHRWNPTRISAGTVPELREQIGLREDGPVVGYVGRLARDKGLVELEKAWKEVLQAHPTAQLLLLGPLDARDPVPEAVLTRLRADPSVHFLGRIPDPVPYYALFDVLVLPSYREGLGVVLLEAAAMGLPVVATHATGIVDAVQDCVTGLLVAPRSASALAEALNMYLGNPSLRERHGKAGRERVLREFREEAVWQAYHAEYEALLRAMHAREYARRGAGKRAFDVAVASLLLLLLAPLLAVIALAVRIELGSPVLFRQMRAGVRGRPFMLHKFRTMREPDGLSAPAARLTRFGSWLRSSSLDELPELWDVLRGHMSIIGPRPLLLDYLPLYTPQQARRHTVRPGVTGWAQVHGRNAISWEERLDLDVWYVDHMSPVVDLRILLQTIPQVVKRKDTSPAGRPFMERFHGRTA